MDELSVVQISISVNWIRGNADTIKSVAARVRNVSTWFRLRVNLWGNDKQILYIYITGVAAADDLEVPALELVERGWVWEM